MRQLRLRDIGGIIVIDFIDMARSRNREAVLKVAAQGARRGPHEDVRGRDLAARPGRDDAPERHRRRARDHDQAPARSATARAWSSPRRRSRSSSARHLRAHGRARPARTGPRPTCCGSTREVTAWFIADGARELHALEAETGRCFHFEGSEGLPLDHFAVTMEGTREEIEERAVPFRAGEEVHVDLVEPHMYNEDDAVAKVDGYLIDVVNGVAFVGEKKLVRIEEAGPHDRPRAVLVGADAEAAEEAARERARPREAAGGAALRRGQEGRGRKARERPSTRRPRPRDARRRPAPSRRHRAGRRRTPTRRGRAKARRRAAARPRREPPPRRRRAPRRGESRRTPTASRGAEARRGRGRRRAILSASAPRPQRWTAPFARKGGRRRSHRVSRAMSYAVIKTGGKQYRVERGPDPARRAPARRRRRHRRAAAAAARRRRRPRVRGRRPGEATVEAEVVGARARPQAARVQVQAQARLQAPHRPPPGADAHPHHVDRLRGADEHGTQEGPRLQPQRPRLQRQAPRREGVRRADRHRRRDHRAPARHALQAGRRRRHRPRRHDLRPRAPASCSSARAAAGA